MDIEKEVDNEKPTAYVSPAEEVRNDVQEAIKQLKGEPTIPEPGAVEDEQPEPVEKSDHPSDPLRYADGTFKPVKQETKPAEPAPKKAAAGDPKLPPVDNVAKPSSAQPSTAVAAAPVSWAADVKALWNSLPPAVQQAVAKREAEMAAGGRQWSEEKQRYQATLAPLIQETQRLGIAPEQGLNALLAAHHRLNANPAEAIAALAQQYGVDLATLASNPPAIQPPRFDPMVSQLTQHVTLLESQLSGFLQNQTLGVVEKFAQEHPHYAAVEDDIARLIPLIQQFNPGLPAHEVLSKAYEQAIWTNQDVRAQLIQEQTAQAQQSRTEAVQAKAQKAQKAAISVKGSSNGAQFAPKVPIPAGGDVYDDVRAAIHQLRQ